ncbi:MAG: glycine--tRNA ligase [Candidatus Sungbacteria bacterium RIFCSPHIGHO2_02_FULL_47_11]|uniref:Glycine--tRNA ligase n=1 Tax=Candidatus Sungbacteria bacterium RIFCSPHIGHO2_02_FULL_47_11 TaxID=1802270 RepID=A0A1G2KNW6_9BACT|nr:MAG: glycine--tRNA ligase [Candidatus Sungbacteria bacterium RIFCSPHIGHO2_02_FULL_47_11]
MNEKEQNVMDKIVALAKRRGFIFPGSEIYGGLAGTWDYGPLGVFLKENIKREWWRHMLREDHIYTLDAAILMNSKVWEASGHLEHFSDPMVDCKKCKKRFRADELSERRCPECKGDLTEARQFNMMFKTTAGPVDDSSSVVYLRPETAQGIFINFKNVVDTFHPNLPFGIVQIGKAFRNEITPRNFLFRAREFEQMELEYFAHPEKADEYFRDIRKMRMEWFLSLGIRKKNIRFRDHEKDELAHYSRAATDIEYRFGLSESGFSELEGIANRGDFDLSNHLKHSGIDLKHEGIIPHVIEPSLGLDRAFLAFFMDAYAEEKLRSEKRVVLHLHQKLAPIKVAVFPLLANKPKLVEKARETYLMLTKELGGKPSVPIAWDDRGNIGKRYYAQDEIGTPWCVTVDFQTLEDDTVTVRDRDTGKQERHKIDELDEYFFKMLI